MKYTVDQIAVAAELSCFYVTPEDLWLRMLYTDLDEGYFQALDEDSGEEYTFTFEEVAKEEDPHFEELTRMKIE
jgi:hypothetical protein